MTHFIVQSALNGMGDAPKPLFNSLAFYAGQEGVPAPSEADLKKCIATGANDPVRLKLHEKLALWDHVESAPWVGGSRPNTAERRKIIYNSLAVSPKFRELLTTELPFYQAAGPIYITDDAPRNDWLTDAQLAKQNFYWKHYHDHLLNKRGWSPEAVAKLHQSTSHVVNQLDCPWQKSVRATRGLVVGYVQSGKTAHFTGVIAKAIDAGYRLVIVLSGMIDLLRNQTQRRLDMELVGKENIALDWADDSRDYADDEDWEDGFLGFSARPSQLGNIDIVRLTRERDDFQSLAAGISALEIEKIHPHKPLYDKENLLRAKARLIVIKKNGNRLEKLLSDLRSTGVASRLEVPALIIDDESDQASVNTRKPSDKDEKKRTTINGRICDLLKLLPRAQYVGYTATAFANVFVNPNDPEDIYPRHFLTSLERPEGYMGVRDFHDLDETDAAGMSNEVAYVRGILEEDDTPMLREAVDAFLLSGAIKLYREAQGVSGRFRHHTMLVHESHLQVEQAKKAKVLRALWKKAAYHSPSGLARLKALYQRDFVPTWKGRGESIGLPLPRFGSLTQWIGRAIQRIESGNSPVLVVNGDEDAETPDFETSAVWKILVGGAKLSRGYTVEGLTISYFRRRSKTQDTLMQMGRWFGFRAGYKDLVRLYIGRAEKDGRKRLDLYAAFEAMCRDEEDFRAQLERYNEPGPDGKRITPLEVPALVFNSHPQLLPTSSNKMFNTMLDSVDFAGEWREPTQRDFSADPRKKNEAAFARLASKVKRTVSSTSQTSPKSGSFHYSWFTAKPQALRTFLEDFSWPTTSSPLRAELKFLSDDLGSKSIDEWLVVLPQLKESHDRPWRPGTAGAPLTCVRRSVVGSDRIKAFTEPRHRDFAEWLVGKKRLDKQGNEVELQFTTDANLKPSSRRGVMLIYPTYPFQKAANGDEVIGGDAPPVIGFGMLLPPRSGKKSGRAVFKVVNIKQPEAVCYVVTGSASASGDKSAAPAGKNAPSMARTTKASSASTATKVSRSRKSASTSIARKPVRRPRSR